MYETYHTPSWSMETATEQRFSYECRYCGVSLQDHEVFLVEGSPYCGCCK